MLWCYIRTCGNAVKPTNHARLRLVLSLQKIISRTKCMPHVRGSVGNFPETVFTRALRIRRYLWQNCANKWYCAPFFTLTLVYISLQKYETWAPCAMCVSSTPVLLFSKVAQKKKGDHRAIVKIFTTTTWHQVLYQTMSPMRQNIKKERTDMSRKHCMTKSASCHDDYPI